MPGAPQELSFPSGSVPHLILMNLSLPELDGLSATKLIRELEDLCDVPIIALTAYDAE